MIQFMKRKGDYDCISPCVNLAGNTAVIGVGGIALATITYIALKALGCTGVTNTIAATISVALGITGVLGVIAALVAYIALCAGVAKAISR